MDIPICVGIIKKDFRYLIKDNKYGTIDDTICKVMNISDDSVLVKYKMPLTTDEITEVFPLDIVIILDDIDCSNYYKKENYFHNHGEIEFLKKYRNKNL